jgi:hypothetical protein
VAQPIRGIACGRYGVRSLLGPKQSEAIFSVHQIVLVVQSCRVPTPPSTGSLVSV